MLNRSRSRRLLQGTCLLLCSSGFAACTTFVCVRVWLLNSPSSAAQIPVSFWQLSIFKCPILPFPSINPPRMSREIKRHPPPEYRQLKTIRTTASTSSSCAGKYCVPITTRSCTGPLKTILSRGLKAQVSSQNGFSLSLLISTSQLLQESNGHSLRRGGASSVHAVGVSIAVLMAWGL
jgi:hypothetical protein